MDTSNTFTFRKNGKLIIKDSVLENIDTLTEEELKELLIQFKDNLSPIMTSVYIPCVPLMKIIHEYAPDMKVRFKTEKSGGTPILPITSKEFFDGEAWFEIILNGVESEWNELQKYKYLYNSLGMMLSYDWNLSLDKNFSVVHDSYARNIFTSIARNWGVCSSFAASYDYLCYRAGLESEIVSEEEHDYVVISVTDKGDYLVDPTWDAAFLKFGIQTQNFGISKEQFIKNGHHLEETEIEDYEIEALSKQEIESLDRTTGYLDMFGGAYTDECIQTMINDLSEETIFDKISLLLQKVKTLMVVGRISLSDYEKLLHYIFSNHPKLKDKIKVMEAILEDQEKVIVIEVTENGISKQFILEEGFDFRKECHQL